MSNPFAPFETANRNPDAAARAWKATGGKVIGYLGNTVPVELIAAANMFPLRLITSSERTPRADRYMEDLFDPLVRAIFEKMLAGGYDFLDAVILPRTSDSVQRLYYYLCEVERMGEAKVPKPLLYDLLHTPGEASASYNRARTAELKSALEDIAERRIDDSALKSAIAQNNAWRAGLEAVAGLRRGQASRLSGPEAHAIFVASQTMARDEFVTALEPVYRIRRDIATRPRLVLAGSGHIAASLHRLIEKAGATVVGDYHEFGEPMIGPAIATDGSLIDAIAAHYHRGVFSGRTYPDNTDSIVDFAREATADGVVFYYFREEEALTWEYPAQRKALEAAGLPSICFENMRPLPGPIADEIGAFIARLRQKVTS